MNLQMTYGIREHIKIRDLYHYAMNQEKGAENRCCGQGNCLLTAPFSLYDLSGMAN